MNIITAFSTTMLVFLLVELSALIVQYAIKHNKANTKPIEVKEKNSKRESKVKHSEHVLEETEFSTINYVYCINNQNCFKDTLDFKNSDQQNCKLINEESSLFGRAKSVNLIEGDSSISRIHFEIELKDGIAKLKDCNSTNGTFLNGKRVEDEVILKEGDIIGAGETKLIFETITPINDNNKIYRNFGT